MITGYELIEKMYSENYDEYEDTRLYSTGDDELDDLLERAFCEGYEYAQKEFGRTGLSKGQAKMWFEGGNGKLNKELKRLDETIKGVESLKNAAKFAKEDLTKRGRMYDLDKRLLNKNRNRRRLGRLEKTPDTSGIDIDSLINRNFKNKNNDWQSDNKMGNKAMAIYYKQHRKK